MAHRRVEHRRILQRNDDGRIVAPGPCVDFEIREEFKAVRADLRIIDERVGEVEVRLRDVEIRLSDVDFHVREEAVATRRHFDVVAESLRDDIRIIAEGLITLDAKVEAMRKI